MKKIILHLLLIVLTLNVYAQKGIDTDIFLVPIKNTKNKVKFGNPINITHKIGYDNQPSFKSDTELIFTASPDSINPFTDIFLYNIVSNKLQQLTFTDSISEFSPLYLASKSIISLVTIEKDNKTQTFSKIANSKSLEKLLPKVDNIGYYTWLNDNEIVYFAVTSPASLCMASVGDTTYRLISGEIGRCIQKIPGSLNCVSFVHKISDKNWVIKRLNTLNYDITTITNTLEGIEDYVWLNKHTLLMGKDGILYSFDTRNPKRAWKPITDFNTSVGNFYRLAVSPSGNYLAIVAYVGKKP